MLNKITLPIILLIILALFPLQSTAENGSSTARWEYGALTGYGISHVGFGATNHQIQTWDLMPRVGYFLSDQIGKGSWYQGRHEILFEFPSYHLAVDHGGRSMVGAYLLGHWKFTSMDKFAPYVFAGGGPVYVDLGLPTMGTKWCFSYQAGTGLQYFIKENFALDFQYRYHHISNASTASPNEPLNSSKVLFGVTFYR